MSSMHCFNEKRLSDKRGKSTSIIPIIPVNLRIPIKLKSINMREKDIPMWLSHKPIVSVDYETQDACAGDAKFLSIGKSTWNENDISAKIWRKSHDQWSPRVRKFHYGEYWIWQNLLLPLSPEKAHR